MGGGEERIEGGKGRKAKEVGSFFGGGSPSTAIQGCRRSITCTKITRGVSPYYNIHLDPSPCCPACPPHWLYPPPHHHQAEMNAVVPPYHAERKAVMQQSSSVMTSRLPLLARRHMAQMTSKTPVFCS